MAEANQSGGGGHKPYVSSDQIMPEFTPKAVILGLILCVVLGAANAYLGLKAGMTIAATYPAAVIALAVLRALKGNILEENMARTIGSIGESVAAGAAFTIPAFFIGGLWKDLGTTEHYLQATAIMMLGGFIGILFVTILRRPMVEDPDLPFPESKAAAGIHLVGQTGGSGSKYLFGAMAGGAVIQALGALKLWATEWVKFIPFGHSSVTLKGVSDAGVVVKGGGGALLMGPGVSPAYIGVGFIIGPRVAALNFAGGLLAWGLLVPVLMYFMGDQVAMMADPTCSKVPEWPALALATWKFMVRPIAIGGMLVAAGFTLFRMRKNLYNGLKRSFIDAGKAGGGGAARVDRDLSLRLVLPAIGLATIATFALYWYFSGSPVAAAVAALVMVIAGFGFSAASGYLVGMIGSSNNPISGLTVSTLIIAALLMVVLGMTGTEGVAASLGVAAVICVAAAVAGEMLQDLKVGHILGGTPSKMQVGDIIGIVAAAAVMFFPLLILHEGNIKAGGMGFGDPKLSAPQAGLMAMLAQGIIGGDMAWPLVIVGMLMAVAMICLQVKSPMLVSVGMYLPLETTFAIFVGGMFRGLADWTVERRGFNKAQQIRTTNTGMLVASGFIAGEALMGLGVAALAFFDVKLPAFFPEPSYLISLAVFALIAWCLVRIPLGNAGKPDDPPPPEAVM
ncbi:MAG: oligopeptide transporter, OPT family [Deltaproteobacteria bacterium]|nr:oligopeptide transporter, OPT family [Deltaproteobacteria bacterium]